MLDREIIQQLAHEYDEAERNRTRVRSPSIRFPEFTINDAYEVQRCWVEQKVSRGNAIRGHKIGFTSRAMQRTANITEPDFGALLADMFYEDGADLPVSRFLQPRLECEIGFAIGRPLKGPNCTIFDVLNATDYVVPAVEIVDGRTYRVDPETNRPRTVLDSIADNAGNAALVTGGRPTRPNDIDLRWAAAICHRNNVVEESGVAAAVLNHPANGVAWLANKLARFGMQIEAGQFVLGGSFTGLVEVRAGDTFYVDYGPLGSVSARFV
ncbi:2-oxo-hepta-3-ene-1,7-dioic acid hydratase [Paraburkholderia steynii]|uniref:2-oxo-hepta-3-ene-1,7-dioic acid hydratase n=1 Tax=Paraburkholderia steynii TaxID=1245441 RepID=A0A4R0XKY4_9BURK|nr:2-oxo-hepta-3-ene-1,7-dioic acid hydratase [Paraburkholderia steynii]